MPREKNSLVREEEKSLSNVNPSSEYVGPKKWLMLSVTNKDSKSRVTGCADPTIAKNAKPMIAAVNPNLELFSLSLVYMIVAPFSKSLFCTLATFKVKIYARPKARHPACDRIERLSPPSDRS